MVQRDLLVQLFVSRLYIFVARNNVVLSEGMEAEVSLHSKRDNSNNLNSLKGKGRNSVFPSVAEILVTTAQLSAFKFLPVTIPRKA